MFPLSLESCQKTLSTESVKAVNALAACTAAVLGDERRRLVLDAREQQRIEDWWGRNLQALVERCVDCLESTVDYSVGDTVEYSHLGGRSREIKVTARHASIKDNGDRAQAGFDGVALGVKTWGYDTGVVRVVR